MKTILSNALRFLSLVPISISFVAAQARAAQGVPYVCGTQGCHIQNVVKTMPIPDGWRAQILGIIKRPIQALIEKNLKHIAGLSLPRLFDEISSLEFIILSQGYVAAQGRFTGLMYKVEEKTVYMHIETLKEFSLPLGRRSMEGILLHEGLGALGYMDDDYQISSFLMALDSLTQKEIATSSVVLSGINLKLDKRSKSPSGPLREAPDVHTKEILADGGSTTAGGGGDPLMALIKARLIAHAIKNQESSAMINAIVNSLRIEKPLGYHEFEENNLTAIRKYPLSYDEFSMSIQSERDENRLTVLLGVEGYRTPLMEIENHILHYLKRNNFMDMRDEKK